MVRHLGLVSETARVSAADVTSVAAAIQKQLVRDFTPIWGISATMSGFVSLQQMPSDYVPVVIRDDIGAGGAVGIHRGPANQPYALVQAGPQWSVQVSHEVLELLVDPSLDRLVAGPSLKPGQQRVNYLVEVCDPCQRQVYDINGVAVCDFCTPDYFAPGDAPSRCSFTGALARPRDIRPGGYLSWFDIETNQWWMGFPLNGTMRFVQTGMPNAALSLREFIDGESAKRVPAVRRRTRAVVSQDVTRAAAARARALRAEIARQLRVATNTSRSRRIKPKERT